MVLEWDAQQAHIGAMDIIIEYISHDIGVHVRNTAQQNPWC